LPKGFVRIRHYGILSSVIKKDLIPHLQEVLGKPILPEKTTFAHRQCPRCRKGELVTLFTFEGRAPPMERVIKMIGQRFSGIVEL
jgi:hypothetical protein